jgi:hypothetical protein
MTSPTVKSKRSGRGAIVVSFETSEKNRRATQHHINEGLQLQ